MRILQSLLLNRRVFKSVTKSKIFILVGKL